MVPTILSWARLGLLAASFLPVQADKAVNVALQASFHSPPFLLELLLVTIKLSRTL